MTRQVTFMSRKSYAREEIIKPLRTKKIEKNLKVKTMEEFVRTSVVHAVTFAKWKREYGGLQLGVGQSSKRA
jgi:hypothetical protein